MDLNLVVLCGRLAVEPELKELGSGTRLIRFLVTVRSDEPKRRVDVVPVTLWDPGDELVDDLPEKGRRVWVCGAVQRRFWETSEGRRSRLEVVAEQVHLKDVEDLEPIAV
jgi:single-stranded DNA-binding protein